MTTFITELNRLLADIGAGELIPTRVTKESWEEQFSGNQVFNVGGWTLEIFNDCGEADYIDKATSPSGEVREYDTEFFESCNFRNIDDKSCEVFQSL
jgi:hypothetical protein